MARVPIKRRRRQCALQRQIVGCHSGRQLAGASEGIHALLAYQATHGGGRVHVFDGEYEGYAYTAGALEIPVVFHPRDEGSLRGVAESIEPGDTFWLSQPSAIDGNLWSGFATFTSLLAEHAPGARLVVDLTYVGAVPGLVPISLENPLVSAVLWSLSKPFGVYYHRIGGLLTREEIPSLRGQLWFKNLFSLALGERLMATFGPGELPRRYLEKQASAVSSAIAEGTVPPGTRASDVVLLAHGVRGDATWDEYRRGAGLRFCLSPSMDAMINREQP